MEERPFRAAVGVQIRSGFSPRGPCRRALIPEADFITLARVVKTQGRHGEVAAELHTNVPDRFSEGMKLFALGKVEKGKTQDSRRELEVEDFWPHKGLIVLKLKGVDSMSDAETLIGSELQVPSVERAKLEQGWAYISDLIGCSVSDHGRDIGQIEDVHLGAGEAPLLIVKSAAGKKFDLPFAQAYLENVNMATRQVNMNLPEGMLEINGPMTTEEKQEQQRPEKRKKH